MYQYTIWYRKFGIGWKRYWLTKQTADELREILENDGCEDVLVWPGNWFGLAPDNLPNPDITYGIQEDKFTVLINTKK